MLKAALLFTPILAFLGGNVWAAGVSHHGGPILHCEPPQFFDETPAKDGKVASFQQFSVTASDNTDPGTIKLWVNNQPVAVTVTEQRSGRFLVEGKLPVPLSAGKAWVRVTGDSRDGCDELYVWTVYVE